MEEMREKKNIYETPELELLFLEEADVVTISEPTECNDTEHWGPLL